MHLKKIYVCSHGLCWREVGEIDTVDGVQFNHEEIVCPGQVACHDFDAYDEPPLQGWVVPLVITLFVVMTVGGVYSVRKIRRERAASEYRRKHAMRLAQEEHERALEHQRKALEFKKAALTAHAEYPLAWRLQTSTRQPVEGLVEVEPDTWEFWSILEKLRQVPDPALARGNSSQGLNDAWITKLERVQNPDLYAYHHFQRERAGKTFVTNANTSKIKKASNSETEAWHGTSGFDALNICNDKQNGFMVQFASKGQWGRGLYFAAEPGTYLTPAQHNIATALMFNHSASLRLFFTMWIAKLDPRPDRQS